MLNKFGNPLLDQDSVVRELISTVIRDSTFSREQIAERMSALTGQPITHYMLNDYSAECKKQHRFPLGFVAAFCAATGDDRLQRLALGPRLSKLLALGEHRLAAEQVIRALLNELAEDNRHV